MDLTQEQILELVKTYGLKAVLAIVTLVIGLWIVGAITGMFRKALKKGNTDQSLQGFLVGLVNVLLKVLLFISVASMVGIETTSFVAVLGAASFAVGLALQGSLANFAGGVMLLIFKPFKVGDYIEGAGESGSVKKIDILHTTLNTPDNKVIIIPNGPMANSNITNYSTLDTRRVDFAVGISYDADIKQAREVILNVLKNDSRVLKDPAPVVFLTELADNSLNLSARAWVNAPDYWAVFFDDLETIKEELDKVNIGIPYPQRDIHVYNH